jgi:hypothetical protein
VVVVIIIAGILLLPPAALASIGPMTESRAERIAEQIVEDEFPEFAGKPSSARELVGQSGEPSYIVSYSYLSQVRAADRTIEIPRILVIEVSKDGQDIFVTESN